MAVGDEMVAPEGSISSLVGSLKSSVGGDPLSPEDAAWVDSCLVQNLDISDTEWGSLKDAFLEIISVHVEPQKSSFGSETNSFPRGADVEMVPSSDGGIEQPCGSTDTTYGTTTEEALSRQYFQGQPAKLSLSDAFLPTHKGEDDKPQDFQEELSEISMSNAFLPTYKEEEDSARVTDMVNHFDSGLQISSAHAEVESVTDDIFRVWDLNIPAEEDELVKQLEKALSETSLPSVPSEFDDSGLWKDCKLESLDDLVAGISELSLDQAYP